MFTSLRKFKKIRFNKTIENPNPQQNKSLWAADLGTPLDKKSNIPKKNTPEAIAYLRLMPRESASGLFFEKGNMISVISTAKK